MNIYKSKKLSYISSVIIVLMLLVFFTRSYIPNEINIFANEKKTLNLSSNIFSFDANETVVVSNSTDKKLVLENQGNSDETVTVKLLGIPIKSTNVNVLTTKKLIPSGKNVGINIKTDGVMVLGTGAVTDKNGVICKPWENKIKPKDILLEANGTKLSSKEQLTEIINANSEIDFLVKRDNATENVQITTVASLTDNSNKIGVWVRDGTEGIGTLTYINPDNGTFGALGHGVLDVDTNELMPVKTGKLLDSKITTINKGEKGDPGELIGNISSEQIGTIKINTNHGLYGTYSTKTKSEPLNIGLRDETQVGNAQILCDIGNGVQSYDIVIENINLKSTDEKSMIIRIIDETLLSKTNGIIQGMSGSPIIQDNKIIGAVTHVFVQDPTKGYGIFIENMLSEEKNIN